MERHLSADIETKLSRLAAQRGLDREALAIEAVEHMVNYDAWFVQQVEIGLAQVEAGQTMTDEEVGKRLELHLAKLTARLG